MTAPSTDELKALLDKVTQGEWAWESKRAGGSIRALTILGTYNDIICADEYAGSCWIDVPNQSDATLIALAPTLAAEVIRLRAEVLRLSEAAGYDRA